MGQEVIQLKRYDRVVQRSFTRLLAPGRPMRGDIRTVAGLSGPGDLKIRTERKYIEILRILKNIRNRWEQRGSRFDGRAWICASDRAVQYYTRYLDEMGFTENVGNMMGPILTHNGMKPRVPL